MAPTKQGSYEFDKDSLVEFRKSLGISQSKMAELLGVPPNTLSRWETGATVPDAGSLATVYSVAKDYGVAPPVFFTERVSTPEFSLESEPSGRAANALAFFGLLQSYLATRVEHVGTSVSPMLRIEIRNTAPTVPEWPKVVFTGVCLSIAGIEPSRLGQSDLKIIRPEQGKVHAPPATPWQYDEKRMSQIRVYYQRLEGAGFGDLTPAERQSGQPLFPGESVVYEIKVRPEQLPYLRFRTEGTLSRRYLSHREETFAMPDELARPSALAGLSDYEALNVGGPLRAVIEALPDFGKDTRLSEIEAFSKVLAGSTARAKELLAGGINSLWREHDLPGFRAHLRATYIHLDRVSASLARMKEAIESNISERMSAEADAVRVFESEALLLDSETRELLRRYSITEEELRDRVSKLKTAA